MSGERTYRFGPLERGGVLLGLRWPQLGLLIDATACVLGALHSPPLVAVGWVLTAAALCLVAFARIQDCNVDQWLPILYGFTMQKVTGNTMFRGGPFRQAPDQTSLTTMALPGPLSRLVVLAVPTGTGHHVAVVKDTRRKTYTAVLQVRAASSRCWSSGSSSSGWTPGASC